MADRTFSALAAVPEGNFAKMVLAGVAKDRSLHLLSFDPSTGEIGKFHDRSPLQPPQPGYFGDAKREMPSRSTHSRRGGYPCGRSLIAIRFERRIFGASARILETSAGFLVGTSSGDAIWIWHEQSSSHQSSGWINFGNIASEWLSAECGCGWSGLSCGICRRSRRCAAVNFSCATGRMGRSGTR